MECIALVFGEGLGVIRIPSGLTRSGYEGAVWMSDDAEGVALRMQKAIDDCKQGLITKEELRAIAFQAAGELELGQWRIIENLRMLSPEVADVLKAKLREGSGNA